MKRGVWLGFGEPNSATVLMHAGFDWVCLDAQHGSFDDAAVRACLTRAGETPVLVRVLANQPWFISRALDAGAAGVIVPLIEDAQDARRAVQAAHHPPMGTRSWGPTHGVVYPERPFVAVMIETATALAAVDQIAAIDDLDMLFVGPFDLAKALGRDPEDLIDDASDGNPLAAVVAAAREHGILTGAYGGRPERAARLARHGFDWISVTTDVDLLVCGSASVLQG